jgi:rfaE bifunctional protein kinase chain/domain
MIELSSNKKVVFVSGHFNLIHPGHLRLLRFAKECGDYLMVGIESDQIAGKNAYVSENHRLDGVKSNSWVDEAFIIKKSVRDTILNIKPEIVVKGKEFQYEINEEKAALETYGGELIFSSGESTFSSLDFLRKEMFDSSVSISLPDEFIFNHDIKKKELISLIKKFKNQKVCVIGDLIIDEYITCEPLGMSQEEPTIVVTPIDSINFVGGAGIVAMHSSGLGAQTTFLSLKGSDSTGVLAEKLLKDAGVKFKLIEDKNRPTTLKKRYRCKGKDLLRVSQLIQSSISIAHQDEIFNQLESIIEDLDLIVFSDFNYGCLPQQLVDRIIVLAKKNNVYLSADSQSSSQTGDVSRFQQMDILTPTEREARIAVNNREDGIVILTEKLRDKSGCKNLILKLGEEGILIHSPNNESWLTDRISSLNNSPRDVSGAGDSLLITASLSFSCGGSIWESSLLGSLAAAIQISRVGNSPLQFEELIAQIQF